jgi:hypothetical protein
MVKTIIDIKVLNACAGYLLGKIHNSSNPPNKRGQKHGRKEKRIVSVTKKDIINLLLKQNFCCAVSHVPFPIFNTQSGYLNASKENTINTLALPSVDRIDSKGHYTLDNIEITTTFYNTGKGAKSKQNAIEILNFIKNKTKTMSNLKQTQSLNRELLIIYGEEGRYDLAEAYLGGNGYSIKISNTTSKASSKQSTYEAFLEKKKQFDSLIKYVGETEVRGMKNISELKKDPNGYCNAKLLISSGLATKIISKGIILYAVQNATRGYMFYIKKTDYNAVK